MQGENIDLENRRSNRSKGEKMVGGRDGRVGGGDGRVGGRIH